MPKQVIIKRYGLTAIGRECARYGRRGLLIFGNHFEESDDIDTVYASLSLTRIEFDIEKYPGGEPETAYVDDVVSRYKDKAGKAKVDFVVGIGGGSVLDAAKAIAGLLTNEGGAEEYLETADMRVMENDPLPFVAIPTTAGTGAEATKNSVLKNSDKKIKKSFRDDRLVADSVIIDASLYLDAPQNVTAQSGADALAQLIESFTGRRATPETDELCRKGLKRLAQGLVEVYKNGDGIAQREEAALAAYESGAAISNSSVGAVHAFASPIGAYIGLPHGLICGILLPRVMEVNKKAAEKKLAEIGRILSGKEIKESKKAAEEAISAVGCILSEIGIPASFSGMGLEPFVERVVADCIDGASMKANAAELDTKACVKLLKGLC